MDAKTHFCVGLILGLILGLFFLVIVEVNNSGKQKTLLIRHNLMVKTNDFSGSTIYFYTTNYIPVNKN